MREYEVVYIFRPDLESDAVDERLESFHERLDGEVTAVEHWGQRELAYEIEGERRGYYAVVQFRAEPGSLSEFEQALKHDEQLIRHLLVLSEGEMPIPPSERREDEEEDEEEEGEDEEDADGEETENEGADEGDGGDEEEEADEDEGEDEEEESDDADADEDDADAEEEDEDDEAEGDDGDEDEEK